MFFFRQSVEFAKKSNISNRTSFLSSLVPLRVNFPLALNEHYTDPFESEESMSSSIVNEFSLFCDRADLVKHSTTLFMLGTGLGAIALQV